MSIVSAIISIIALSVSLLTFWFTILRRGKVRSTRPSFVAFRYDFVGKTHPQAKIFLRTLLYSTAKRGWVVENLYLRVSDKMRTTEFSFWGHGDKDLTRGSGLFVPENGVVTNHHFNPLESESLFRFNPGPYKLELVAQLVGRNELAVLWTGTLNVPTGAFDNEITPNTSVYCNWSSEKQEYVTTVESR